jgi:hypothetical protein
MPDLRAGATCLRLHNRLGLIIRFDWKRFREPTVTGPVDVSGTRPLFYSPAATKVSPPTRTEPPCRSREGKCPQNGTMDFVSGRGGWNLDSAKGRDQTVRRVRNMPGESVDWTRVVQLVCSFWLFPLLPSEVLTGRLQRWRGGKEPSAVQRDGQLYSAVCMSPNHNSRYSAKGGKRVRMYRLHTSIH